MIISTLIAATVAAAQPAPAPHARRYPDSQGREEMACCEKMAKGEGCACCKDMGKPTPRLTKATVSTTISANCRSCSEAAASLALCGAPALAQHEHHEAPADEPAPSSAADPHAGHDMGTTEPAPAAHDHQRCAMRSGPIPRAAKRRHRWQPDLPSIRADDQCGDWTLMSTAIST